MANAPGWAAQLEGVDPAAVNSRAGLAKLPVLRKTALKELQAKSPPYGGFTTAPAASLARIYMSPGPIFEPEGFGEDWWRTARAHVRRRHAQGRHRPQHVLLSPDAWRVDPGLRRARARLRRHRRRPRQHRAAARRHPIPEAHGLRRRARLPEDPARQGQGGRQGRLLLQEGAGRRRGAVSLAAGRVQGARHRHLSDLRHRRRRHHRLREPGARGHDRRRGRDPGDRAAGHRRAAAGGRGRRGGRHHLQPRLSDDPLRHRRSLGGAAGHQPVRAHQHAHQGLARPRRPDHQGQGHVRASRAGRRGGQAPCRASDACAWWWRARASRTP